MYKVTFDSVDSEGKRYWGDYVCADSPEEYCRYWGVNLDQIIPESGHTYRSAMTQDKFGKFYPVTFKAAIAPHVHDIAMQEARTAKLHKI